MRKSIIFTDNVKLQDFQGRRVRFQNDFSLSWHGED